jgi:hypothetical protein
VPRWYSDLNGTRGADVAVGVVGLAIIIYGLVKASVVFASLGVVLLLFALFHRRLRWFRILLGPDRIEAEGELVEDLGDEDGTTPPEPRDAPPGPRRP